MPRGVAVCKQGHRREQRFVVLRFVDDILAYDQIEAVAFRQGSCGLGVPPFQRTDARKLLFSRWPFQPQGVETHIEVKQRKRHRDVRQHHLASEAKMQCEAKGATACAKLAHAGTRLDYVGREQVVDQDGRSKPQSRTRISACR